MSDGNHKPKKQCMSFDGYMDELESGQNFVGLKKTLVAMIDFAPAAVFFVAAAVAEIGGVVVAAASAEIDAAVVEIVGVAAAAEIGLLNVVFCNTDDGDLFVVAGVENGSL